jgi:hypothetical protein
VVKYCVNVERTTFEGGYRASDATPRHPENVIFIRAQLAF